MKNAKTSVTRLLMILVVLFGITLAGCVTTSQQMPKQPAKPILEIQANPIDPKGICLDRDNTYLLLDYLWQLQEGYE